MMFSSRLQSSFAPVVAFAFSSALVVGFVSAVVLAIAGCSPRADSSMDEQDTWTADASADDRRPRPRPPHADAQPPAPDADLGQTGGGGAVAAGIVSCYLSGDPGSTCARPSHCCFSNFTAQHDGECSNAACSWGTIDCDGPEDCATGQHCCAHVLQDPDDGIFGYKVACQAAACGPSPASEELCHPTSAAGAATCPSAKTCVSASDFDYDLPRSLSICR